MDDFNDLLEEIKKPAVEWREHQEELKKEIVITEEEKEIWGEK